MSSAPVSPLQDLELLIRARYGLVRLRTEEEDRAESLLGELAGHLELPFFVWSHSQGLKRQGEASAVYSTQELRQALAHIEGARQPAVYLLRGLNSELLDPAHADLLRRAAHGLSSRAGALVLSGSEVELPEAAAPLAAALDLPAPELEDYRELLRRVLSDLSNRMTFEYDVTGPELSRILNALRGLTLLEAERVLTRAIVEDGRLAADDLAAVIDAKRQIVERDGLLEYFPADRDLADVAGLEGLKGWLRQRRGLATDPERAARLRLTFPKGVLLLGVPGCGKSLSAKAVAAEWGLPLLRFDPSQLYNKYIGETEKNFRRAIRTAERVAPVVLWIDEIEKAFSTATEDGGTSQRVFASFLSWMQERRSDVFVVATANDIERLPPEFLRKGRFDEIFFVDLPDDRARRTIFEIHLRKREQEPAAFDLAALAAMTEGFSGAEIEQAIVAALFAAVARDSCLDQAQLVEEVRNTRPLAESLGEKVAALRAWAAGRIRSAH